MDKRLVKTAWLHASVDIPTITSGLTQLSEEKLQRKGKCYLIAAGILIEAKAENGNPVTALVPMQNIKIIVLENNTKE